MCFILCIFLRRGVPVLPDPASEPWHKECDEPPAQIFAHRPTTRVDFYHAPFRPTPFVFHLLRWRSQSLSLSHPICLCYTMQSFDCLHLSPSLPLSLSHRLSQSRFMTCPKCNAYVRKYIRRTYSHAALQDAPKINPTQSINSFRTKGTWK